MRRIYLFFAAAVVCATAVFAAPSRECTDIAETFSGIRGEVPLSGSTWLYQLQDANPAEIAETVFDIVVIDYSRTGEEDGRYSKGEMEKMRGAGLSRRHVLAYLSIGEAEDYRYYFDPSWTRGPGRQPAEDAPCWLGKTNPEWPGNYKVQYWSEGWQRVILEYLDRIIDDGFDGVYLDIIDAYEYWGDEDNPEGFFLDEETAAKRMISFVNRIARHARLERKMPGFAVVPQNGEGILDYDTPAGEGPVFLDTISGLGIEDLYFDGTDPVDDGETARRKSYIDLVTAAGKPVLLVDYFLEGRPRADGRKEEFLFRARDDGYIPFPALEDRELDRIP